MPPQSPARRAVRVARVITPLALIAASLAVFWRTAYPSITWWDSSDYSLAAATLGVASAPGSLLLTLLGWPVAHVPVGLTPAHTLNLFAGLLAALAVGLVYLLALRLLRMADAGEQPELGAASLVGAALGALTFAFSPTLWEHAIKFTPYILTAVFTGLILLTMLRWWEGADRGDAWRWLLLLAFLFGLDFSVHRTNALLIPGAIAWIALRRPRTLLSPRSCLVGMAGLAAGLAVQLLVIPIGAYTRSPLDMLESPTWSGFWSYVSLAQRGGGFLVSVWPRNAPFWSVQVADFLRSSGDSFLHLGAPVWLLGCLPAVSAGLGLVALWRRDRRLAAALALVLLLHAAATVVYFNIPAHYFRPLDRHYLPVFMTIGVLAACGLSVAARAIAAFAGCGARARGLALAAAGLIAAALVPAAQLRANWTAHDASRRYFTRDYAANALRGLPHGAIYLTVGDNDTFPAMYVQSVEGIRPDVRLLNLSLANLSWYVERIARLDPSFPVSRVSRGHNQASGTQPVDTVVEIPIRGTPAELGLVAGTALPESITLRPRARLGTEFLPADAVLMDILRTSAWRAPLCFAISAGSEGMGWLQPYARLDGLFWRILPVQEPPVDPAILRANLLSVYAYRGYADPAVLLDDVSRTMGQAYFPAIGALLEWEEVRGSAEMCREAKQRLLAALPPDRLGLTPADRERIQDHCHS